MGPRIPPEGCSPNLMQRPACQPRRTRRKLFWSLFNAPPHQHTPLVTCGYRYHDSERRWSHLDKTIYGLVWAIKQWRNILRGEKFFIQTAQGPCLASAFSPSPAIKCPQALSTTRPDYCQQRSCVGEAFDRSSSRSVPLPSGEEVPDLRGTALTGNQPQLTRYICCTGTAPVSHLRRR